MYWFGSSLERTPRATQLARTSSAARERIAQMRSSQSRCSDFMSTERRHKTLSRSDWNASGRAAKNRTGKRIRARCKFCFAAASKMRCDNSEISVADFARGAQTTISSSGANGTSHRASLVSCWANCTAALRLASSILANSPPRTSGSRRCVAHKATAEAPGREHSRLISPRWRSDEVK